MKYINYTCSICGEPKRPRDVWTMASSSKDGRIIFMKWNSKSKSKNVKHLCGPDCETKHLLAHTSELRKPSPSTIQGATLIKRIPLAPYVSTKITLPTLNVEIVQ